MKTKTQRSLWFLSILAVAAVNFSTVGINQLARASSPYANVSALLPGVISGISCSTSCDLYASQGLKTFPGIVANMPFWGFATTPSGVPDLPGPTIIADQGDTLTIVLHNNLPLPSVNPGDPPLDNMLALNFPQIEMVPDFTGISVGGTKTYTFTVNKPGTFLFEAGQTPYGDRQLAMGLYGALIVRPAGFAATHSVFGDVSSQFDDEALLVLSEVNPDFNRDWQNYNMQKFRASLWLINGRPFPFTKSITTAVTPDRKVLLRYINAGLVHDSLGLLNLSQTIIAADGNPVKQYSVTSEIIGAGQTYDALVTVPVDATPQGLMLLYNTGLYQNFMANTPANNINRSIGFGGQFTFLAIPDATGPTVDHARVDGYYTNGQPIHLTGLTFDPQYAFNIAAVQYVITPKGAPAPPLSACQNATTNFAGPDADYSKLGPAAFPNGIPATPRLGFDGVIDPTANSLQMGNWYTVYVCSQDEAGLWGSQMVQADFFYGYSTLLPFIKR